MRDAPSLDEVDAKIARAKHHLIELEDVLQIALDPRRYRFAFDSELENGQHVYRVQGVPKVDRAWSLIVGDCLHNLRSALDYLAWQLVLLDGGDPTTETQFPIRHSPPTQLKPAIRGPEILDALERAQPYHEVGGPHNSSLWALKELNNIDKHRLLLVVACVFDRKMWWGSDEGEPKPSVKVNVRPLKDGDAVALFDFHGDEPPPRFDPHATLQFSLLEQKTTHRFGRMSVTNALHSLVYVVEWGIIQRLFRGLFSPEIREVD